MGVCASTFLLPAFSLSSFAFTFCTVLESEYDKRLARGGLTLNRAISEVESNMPQRAIYAELYGQE